MGETLSQPQDCVVDRPRPTRFPIGFTLNCEGEFMKKTVQVVEDDFDTLHPLAELLRLKGYTVITASDAEQALQIARKQKPDLIITDIVLPGKSGLHFITAVRSDEG